MTYHCTDDQAVCRGCGRHLDGSPYFKGGRAFLPGGGYREAKVNHYGGWVCSRECDVRAALALEQSMPGHGVQQTRIGQAARERVNRNWPEENR